MGKPFWRSVEYFFTGNYSADDGNNNIVAIGFGGQIHAYGGDDHVTVGSIGATVYTGSGNDTVVGGSAYLKVEDSTGHLTVKGAAGYADINKSGDGNVSFAGAAGGVSIDHLGNHGDVSYGGAAAYNGITRKGLSGNVTFAGAGGYNALWHETNQGNLSFTGAGAGNKLDRTWFNRYQGSHGDVTFDGAGAANSISSRVETGNITFRGAGADNHLVRKGKVGDITLQGAGASNRIERTHQAEDVYTQTRGNIRFEGVGGYNSLYSDVAHGDIHFSGGGAYNTIIRKGSGNDFAKEGMTNAKADEIVLTKAVMSGSWIGQDHHVTAVKSASEPNTYLFAFADSTYTKINKVQLRNDPQTGELKYYSTAWYKEGNHLSNLANQDISDNGGFTAVNINGAYTLSDLKVEHQQSVTVHAVEKSLTEYEWVTYANGAVIDAKEVSLSDAKMGGHAIYADGTKVDVKAVKSNRQPNTYIYAKVLGPYTKIVVVELANDPETGALKYQARSWYKEGDHTANIANQDISSATGYNPMGKGGYSLSDLHYSVNAVRSTSETVADIEEYTDQTLFKPANDSGESSGDVRFNGAGGGNVIKSNVTRGNVHFNGGGIANVILHSSQFGNTEFNGGGAANVIVKSGEEGDLTFRGAGLANVLVHQSQQGKMDVYAGGAVNVLVRLGDGQYLAHLLAYGNISVQKGSGDSRVVMLGGYNTHTQIGSGNGLWLAAGGFNVMTQVGQGDVAAVLAGGANVLTKMGEGELTSGLLGGANVITHISNDDQLSNTTAVALGGANILTKKGKGNTLAVMGGGANVLTHVGDGTTTGVMVGGANILTKVGNGDTTGILLGVGNVLTHVGDGQTLGVMGAAGNIFTKVGDGTSIAVMIGAGNIFTHVGEGNAWALMGGLGNVFTKVGNGDALALMVAEANVFTHIGDGMSVALMLAKGNVATKVGNGTTLAAMVGNANIFTHVGSGSTFAAMIGQANIMTKVGNDLTAALMVGKANIMTHVGDGTSLGLFAGEVNVMTKVGNGTTLAAMFGKANIMTHVGDGLTGVLALGEANIVTKVGDDFMGVVAAAKANVVTHVGDATTAAVLAGKGNILTKVGEGTTVGLLISDVGNVMTHVGDGTTIGIAKGKANIITKVGDGLGVNVAWGQANVFTQVGDGDRYNFAKGEANLITKVGDGQELSVVQGEANIITHVGNGDDYTGAWGKANVITKVGHGQNVVLAKGEANIVTQVGDGDSFNALWSKGNIVTKVGDGMQVTAAKGQANITTTVGNGLSVTAAYGDANINTKVGDGVSVNVAWGKYNINTKVGDGLNVAVMKGKANANIHVGDGLNINASYAQNNVAIKVGNGDFYSLAVASSNTSSNKLSALFDNIKQTVLGVGGSQAINYLVQGDEASSSGTHKGRGAIATPEITKLDGFQMDAIKEVGSDLGDSLTGSVTKVDTPDLNKMQHALNVDDSSVQAPNLIVNGDFEQSDFGWSSTHGVEAYASASSYGLERDGHGNNVSELATDQSTTIYQDIQNLTEGEVIALSFDFAKRAGLSNNEGIEVLWNGEVVFSSSGDESAWQQKTLKLTAQAGSNRIEFKGTGHNDGLGYILDNVVATSESSQQANAIREHATQNPAAQNALSDKERAEADRQRLEQEKQKQLDAVAGSQSQLESTDQQALENNGQAQRDAVQEESEAITAELTKLAQGLDVLDGQATHTGESGDQWRNEFASGLLAGVQTQLDDAKQLANDKIAEAKQTHADNQNKVKDAVAKSEAGVAKGEQNRAGAEQDIADAQADAEKRKADALAKGKDAQQAESDAHHAVNNAQSRGDRDVQVTENKANQAQADAQGAKQNEGDRPDRQGVTGSGLSGNAHSVEGAGETDSHVNTDSQTNADGRFSEGLSEQEQEALEGATNAVNRLQINAGVRGKNSGSTISSMFTETNSDSIVVPTTASQDAVRKEIRISGVNLEGLGEASHDGTLVGTAVNTMLRESLPFYSLRTERNLLVQEGDEGFEVRAWAGTDGKSKTIILKDPEDPAQHKAIERFILANFDNFEQMPDELFLVDNKVISHHEGRTHVLAQKVDGAWQYNAKVELMSVTELLDAANVTGKIRGESYQQVIDALTDYHASITEHADYEPESVEKLLNLRKKIEGYVLGHPDSGRVEAMNSLLNQVNTRLDEVSLLSVAEQTIQAQDSFSRLYDQLEAANLKESKHLYLDQNGDFVTKGKGNLANIDLLGSREAVLEKVKSAVSNEYGQTVADTIFAGLSAKDLAKDGKGIDIAGLNKVHQAIEQHLSPVSATLYIWKPSDHSALGHAALQIGQGRTQLEGQAAADFNQQNYVSWWPLGSKSSNISNILNVATKDQPDLKLRWSDFSQPAHQNDTLEHDVASEENDGFGLHDGDIKLKRFIEKLNAAKGIDASFKEASEGYASVLLGNPDMLETTGIPAHVFQPFVEQWNDTSYDMMDVANRFAQELRLQAQRSDDPELLEKRIGNVVRQFAERALEEIETFKASQADQGRVFRINLEGLDVAAMQAEWHRLSNDPDARYQLLTKNCSSTVAKVLKAGGADKLIGHTWLPKFGVWTPTELFNFGQALQEAQLEIAAKKQSHQVTDVLDALSGNEKPKENVAIENDGTPPRDKESLSPLTRFLNNELYGDKEARRKIGEITQTLLDHAVEKGESQKITLQGEAGRLTGYYHQGTVPSEGETSTPSGKVVLFLHGSGSSAEEQASAIRNHYQKQGIDMLAVNLRGYGESDGGPSEKGLYQDARTMFNYLVNDKGIDPSNIIIHGYSMGGPIAADLARYAAQNGQAVSGLLLDRPMPSMTKAITAHEVANPAGIVGAIAKAVNGQFSVEKNLEGLPKETSILLLTDNEGLGNEGEKLRTKLTASGYNVTGEQTFYGHEASNRLMSQYADQIVSGLSSSASVDEDLDQQGLDTTSTKDQGISNKNDHLQVVDSKEALADGKILHNQDVNGWGPITVTPTTDGGDTRFDGQVIVQMENDPVVAKAAANLAGKHAESSVVVQLDSDGNYRVVYGDPSKLDGKLRWQLVGHGRDHSESNNTRLSGYSADELAVKLAKFQQSFNQAENINNKPDHISIVGCSLVSDDKQKGFGHQFINAMDANGLRVDVSVRSSELAVDEAGRKHTKDANGDWVQKAENNKVSLSWDAQGEVVAKDEPIRNGIAEGDIDLSRIGVSDVDEPARGAIGDNNDVFDAPEKRKPETEVIANSSNSNQLSYSGNIQVNVGEGEFTAVNWGTSNVGIKVGTGGFKSLAFGDNNVMVHIGDGESKHSVDIGGYQALEGAQMFLGNRNVSFNFGHSNDLILMMDKSIPTPPLVNPFDGAARISGVLQGIAMSGDGEDWLAAQEQQWTLSGAKKFVKDMSGLDQSSSVDYTTLVELDSQNERDSRGLKHDAEVTLNKQYNQWLSGNGNSGTSQLSRADKLRQANEKLAFNFAVGGQGADIQVTTGNWNFMFGDNIQSILDTNLGSLFGLMTQQFTATGQAKTTFTYTPQDLPRQLKNKLLGQFAGVGAETTLADIFGVDYTASGQIVSRNGQAVDGVAILKEMLEVIGEFSGDQLQAFVDPAKLLDSLKAGIDMGADGIKSFAETHGLKEKAPEEEKDNSSVSVNGANVNSAQGATVADGNTETAETQDRAFGFNSLNLPNLFATIFSQDKQKEMKSLVENLKQNLTADLLNMKEKTFDFLRNSGHLQGDGDINISLGNYNFNWGGDGKDLGAYLGDNNNFWGGRGDDVFYATGTSNIFTGGEGNDMGVLMGRENMMFGGDGNDTAVVAGRINHVFLGAGDDQSFVFGEGGEIDTGSGRDYVVTSGNFNRVDTGDDQDYSVTIGNNNQVELGAGNDFANVFGNYNRINAGAGNDVVKLMGYHAVLNGGNGDDHLIAAAISKFSQFNGGEGRDLMVLGGYQNTFKGGTDVDSFVVSGDVIDNLVEDIRSEDNIVFNGIDWQKLWFERSGYDLKLSILRDPSNDSDQSKFEHIGSVTFSDYFNGNRAQVVIGMSEKDLSGEREYTMLSDSAIDALVQAMSGFEPQAGDNGFIDSLESKSQATISMAWSYVVHKKGLMV
ncbi:MARTX multifunctional-autoprocessing repeats-in-toxin holotoxin RtxA [Vibrio cholerae]|nr:MARTX multifunctional-autoprocessing repeats-in-toxin holotoxin RtxA [Vibrio cholerae]EKF9161950.1 MARTX multifunctional-autoprocessing repeats-in-toxin holotoxin RtxA [Vibrio cholerae]EKF9980034.1 MARTX multifunctional-autoprocessing repeats-in-toxin holotoxin RtxA [Vibrio cholerae]